MLASQLVHMLSSGGNWVTGHQPHVGLTLLNYCAWGSERDRVLTLLSQDVLVLGGIWWEYPWDSVEEYTPSCLCHWGVGSYKTPGQLRIGPETKS